MRKAARSAWHRPPHPPGVLTGGQVKIGTILFVGFVRIYRHMSHNWALSANPILGYIAERPQIDEGQLMR